MIIDDSYVLSEKRYKNKNKNKKKTMTNILIGIFIGLILFLPMFYIIGKCLGWDKDYIGISNTQEIQAEEDYNKGIEIGDNDDMMKRDVDGLALKILVKLNTKI